MLAKRISEAPKAWNYLNGVINVYKPAGVSVNQVRSTIRANLCRDLNNLEVRPPLKRISISSDITGSKYLVNQEDNIADSVLVVGERYQNSDVRCGCSSSLGKLTSGVLVLGINDGMRQCHKIRENRPIRVYHVTGRLGRSTETHFNDSPVTSRASYDHIYIDKMNRLLTSMQASHQKKMYEMCGVDLQSQAAYELAVQGPIRPADSKTPLIYGMRCIDFKKEYFTIEMHATNETEAYLGLLIHEIALNLKTVGHCTQIRCIRQSHFTLEDSLVRRHWNLQSILGSIHVSNQLLLKYPEMLKQLDSQLKEQQ
ncbi:unnamed protein product [Diamesa serratosioi]